MLSNKSNDIGGDIVDDENKSLKSEWNIHKNYSLDQLLDFQ